MKRIPMGSWLVSFGAVVLGAAAVWGQAPIVTPEPLVCMPPNGHAVMNAVVDPVPAEGDEVRIYFRRQGYGDYYYVVMWVVDEDEPTLYRGVVPVPEPDNVQSELYLGVVSQEGTLISRSDAMVVPITDDDCDTETDDTFDFVVGETSAAQKGRKIAWWQCEDVQARIDVYGEERDEGSCIPIIYWWQRPEILIPAAVGTVGSIVVIDDVLNPNPAPPVSPSTP